MPRPLEIGDTVKHAKWRDCGWTAQVGVEGKVIGYDEASALYKVKVTRISPDSNGWKRGEVFESRREDLIEV